MKQYVFLGTIIAVFLFAGAFLPLPVSAQQEVEVNLVGHWSYAVDPSRPGRVELIAHTSTDHEFHALSGDDVLNSSTVFSPDSYTLDLPNLTNCATSTTYSSPQLYSLTGINKKTISGWIGNGKTYAISIPKPCSYESYVEARAIIGTSSTLPPSQEKSYTVWMVLHYTVSSIAQASLKGSSYSYGLDFLPGITHPSHKGVSIVLYGKGVEDFDCDSHSANAFDTTAKDLWGQTNLHRIFPELYSTGIAHGEQTHRYNRACATKEPDMSNPLAGRTDCHAPQFDINHAVVP
jgi:hypothetical protein